MTQAWLSAWVWLSVGMFVGGCAWRAWRYVTAPVHLRWDLYPVAHEPAARRAYGGSRLEEPEYWTKRPTRDVFSELRTMAEEVVALRGVWRHNRRVFWGSLPFHWGLYLLITATGLLALIAAGVPFDPLAGVLTLTSTAGGSLLAVGALRLLVLRTTDPGLRRYASPLDRLNLALFAAVGALSVAVALREPGMAAVARAVSRVLRFESPDAGALVAAHLLLAGLVVLYLPFTRMIHFFAKYFLYHDVRWDDRLVERGSAMERRLQAALEFGVSWSAPHVGAGRPWREVASDSQPPQGAQGPQR